MLIQTMRRVRRRIMGHGGIKRLRELIGIGRKKKRVMNYWHQSYFFSLWIEEKGGTAGRIELLVFPTPVLDYFNLWSTDGPLRAKYNAKMAGMISPIAKPNGSKRIKE